MGRPAGWMTALTGRSSMKSPGAPALRREVERRFRVEIARSRTSEDAAVSSPHHFGSRENLHRAVTRDAPTLTLPDLGDRILSGTAERPNGALTIVALALEAEVPRNALTQRHTDLKAEFYALVAERGAPSDVETRLRASIAALKKTIANKNAELAQLRTDVPALVRAVNQLTLEKQELREALANPSAEVIPIRERRSRHAED